MGLLQKLARLRARDSGLSSTQRAPFLTELLYCDDDLRISTLGDYDAPSVFLCFTGVRQAMGGIGAEEFVNSTALPGFSAIFVSDLKRSWFNGFEPDRLIALLEPRLIGKRVVTVGNSMGGYGAIWATQHFACQTAIAFAAQFSVHPDIVPGEQRWMEYRAGIKQWRQHSLKDSFGADTRYYTINGSDDALHWRNFPHLANCEHVLIANSAHEPATQIKKSLPMQQLLKCCVDGDPLLPLLVNGGVDCLPVPKP